MKTRLPVAIALVSAIVLAAAQPLQAQPRSSSGCFNISGFYMDADDSDLYSDFAGVSMKIGIYITDTTELFGECMFGDALDMPEDIDYLSIQSLRIEARQKLHAHRPRSLGQASRIPGVSPGDISVLMVLLERMRKG